MTVVKQLSEAQEQIAMLNDQAKAFADEKAKLESQIKELTDAKASAQAAIDAAKAEAEAKLAEQNDLLAKEVEAHRLTAEKLSKAEKALANPAFADAAKAGSQIPVEEGTQAADAPAKTKAQAVAEYNALSDSWARADYRKANWQVLGIKQEK